MTHATRKLTGGLALALLAVALLAGRSVAGTAAQSSSRVTATESEYKIVLSRTSVKAGTYTFVAVNKGKIAHSLAVNGPGVAHKRIAGTIAPGSSKTITVTLRKGSYDVYCPVDGHKALGMDRKLTVQ
jgi:uncharacterized cupredoxin-like copper-binding protein